MLPHTVNFVILRRHILSPFLNLCSIRPSVQKTFKASWHQRFCVENQWPASWDGFGESNKQIQAQDVSKSAAGIARQWLAAQLQLQAVTGSSWHFSEICCQIVRQSFFIDFVWMSKFYMLQDLIFGLGQFFFVWFDHQFSMMSKWNFTIFARNLIYQYLAQESFNHSLASDSDSEKNGDKTILARFGANHV